MKATEQFLPVELFMVLHEMVLAFNESVDKIIMCNYWGAIGWYFPVCCAFQGKDILYFKVCKLNPVCQGEVNDEIGQNCAFQHGTPFFLSKAKIKSSAAIKDMIFF